MTAQVTEMPSRFSRSVGATVKALMARHGVTQVELAGVLGVKQSGVSYRLSGRTPFDINELATVARLFRITTAELVADAEAPHPDGPDRAMLHQSVRHEGLEPPTRWLTNFPSRSPVRLAVAA